MTAKRTTADRRGMKIFAFSLGFFALGSLMGPQLKRLFALDDITVSFQGPGILNVPVAIALQRGFFKEQNLDVKLILMRSDVDRPALATGNVDFTLRGSSTVLSAARGLPVRMLFVTTVKPFWALVVRPEVNAVKELKNKVMSVAGIAGGQHIATRVILKKFGLDPDKDVVFKVISAGSRLPALMSGSMDAGLLEYGEAFRAKKGGFKILLNAAEHYSILAGAIGASSKKLREQPDQVKRFLRANVKGLRYMQDNRSATLETMMHWLKVDREMAEGVYDLSIENFAKDGAIDDATLQGVVNDQLAEAKIKDIPLSQVTDFLPLHQILKEAAFSR